MPRHSSSREKVLPVPPLDMEEIKFWLHIMEEHALFIKTGLPFDKPDLIEEATAFEREFKALRVRADKIQSEKKFAELIADIICSLKEFLRFKRLLLDLSMTNKLGSALPPLFFDHVIREAEYFMAILEKLRAGKKLAVVKALEADFWLRLMADHTKFIGSRLDPSERSLVGVVDGYQAEFDDLSMQARDYVSFFEHQASEVPAFSRFLQDSRSATIRLRDFKQAAYDMIIKNRMLSTIPAALADHVRREADHFLLVLAMMEKGVIKVEKEDLACKHSHPAKFGVVTEDMCDEQPEMVVDDCWLEPECENFDDDVIDNIELDYSPGSEREKPMAGQEATDTNCIAQKVIDETQAVPEPDEKAAAANEVTVKAKVISAAEKTVLPARPSVGTKDSKQGKYKWGGNWPRQLGKIKL